jgi:hypothetical protein
MGRGRADSQQPRAPHVPATQRARADARSGGLETRSYAPEGPATSIVVGDVSHNDTLPRTSVLVQSRFRPLRREREATMAKKTIYRDSKSGRITTEEAVRRSPSTTERERVNVPPTKKDPPKK